MLRRIIKSIVPAKGDIFFTLFEEAAINAHNAANIFVDILNCKSEEFYRRITSGKRSIFIQGHNLRVDNPM